MHIIGKPNMVAIPLQIACTPVADCNHWVRHRKCHGYGSKLWEFWVVNRLVAEAKCGSFGDRCIYNPIWNSLEILPHNTKKERCNFSHLSINM
jgi:hypothetical protein